jgi:hypothetical protein
MHDYTRSNANTKPSLESLIHPSPAPNTEGLYAQRFIHTTRTAYRLQTPFTNFFNHPPPDFLSSLIC